MQDRASAHHLEELKRERAIIGANIASSSVVAAGSLNLAGYLYMAGSEFLVPLLNSVGKYFFFPFAALNSILYAVFAWYHFHLDRNNKYLLVKAIVETIGAVVLTAAVVGYVAFSSLFVLAGPIIFSAFLGAKTVFQLCTAIYFGCKALATHDHVKKHEYREKVKHAILSTVAGVLTTVAIVAVEILAAPYLAILGILAGAFATACAVVRIIDNVIKLKAISHMQIVARHADDDVEMDERQSSYAFVMEGLREDHVLEHSSQMESVSGHDELAIPMRDLSVSGDRSEAGIPAQHHHVNDDAFERDESSEIVYQVSMN